MPETFIEKTSKQSPYTSAHQLTEKMLNPHGGGVDSTDDTLVSQE